MKNPQPESLKSHFPSNQLITIKAKPNAKKNDIALQGNQLVISVTESPVDNKANDAIIKLIKKELGIKVELVKGHQSKIKCLKVL